MIEAAFFFGRKKAAFFLVCFGVCGSRFFSKIGCIVEN